MTTTARDPRRARAEDFPRDADRAAQLQFLLNWAVLAPSGHNTQPWRFRIDAVGLDLLADRKRRLPAVDPADRELVISCGAALGPLEIARGLTAAWLNQALEFADLRPRAGRIFRAEGAPQLLLRPGVGPPVRPSVRRPVHEPVEIGDVP